MEWQQRHIDEISRVLGAECEYLENGVRLYIRNAEKKREVIVEILFAVDYPKGKGNMVIIHTATSHLQMHNCLGYVASEMLSEVAFISSSKGNLSGVIVESAASLTIYTNVDQDLLSADFTALAPEVMMAGIALSLADPIIAKS